MNLAKGRDRHTDYAQEEEHVKFVVQKGLQDLARLHVLVLNACLVIPQSLHSNTALSFGQARRGHGRVREEDEYNDAPCSTKGASV